MKKVLFSLFLVFNSLSCFAISEDTKIILKQMDKRFEQIDKRFEQVDKRFETVFTVLYILMGLVFASPFIAIYLRDKKEQDYLKTKEQVKELVTAFKELAQDDPKIRRSLNVAGIL